MKTKYPLCYKNGGYEARCCGKGWDLLLDRCLAAIEAELAAKPELQEGFYINDIKEKFGTLRFYFNGGNDVIEAVVAEAEFWSARTCESCGNPGILVSAGHWVSTRCPECKKPDEVWTRKLSDWIKMEDTRIK